MTQPTELDPSEVTFSLGEPFDIALELAIRELNKFPTKQESYESYVKAEMADHLDVPQPQD